MFITQSAVSRPVPLTHPSPSGTSTAQVVRELGSPLRDELQDPPAYARGWGSQPGARPGRAPGRHVLAAAGG